MNFTELWVNNYYSSISNILKKILSRLTIVSLTVRYKTKFTKYIADSRIKLMHRPIFHACFWYILCTVAQQIGLRDASGNWQLNNFVVINLIVSYLISWLQSAMQMLCGIWKFKVTCCPQIMQCINSLLSFLNSDISLNNKYN